MVSIKLLSKSNEGVSELNWPVLVIYRRDLGQGSLEIKVHTWIYTIGYSKPPREV